MIAAGFTVRLNALVVEEPPVHCTVKLAVVAVVGVPLSTPPLLSVNPAGKEPALMDHEYGIVPPLPVNVPLYATPAVAVGKGEAVVIVSAAGFTVRLNAWVVEEPPVHCTVKLAVVAVMGVPLSTPPLLSVNPAGKAPALMDQE